MIRYFREKQQEQGKETTYETRCPYCSVQCSMSLLEERIVKRNRFKAIPNKQDPTSEGRLCIKGFQAHQHAIHRDRLRYPLLKVDGEWMRISWDLALEILSEKIEKTQQEAGKDAVAVYGGGSLTNEEAYLLGKFARVVLKTKYIDYNGRYCMSSAAAAANATFGIDRGITNELSEVEEAECIILAGTNIAECQPTLMPYFRRAKKKGASLIVIDPRETGTTKLADLHIQGKPGMDGAIAVAMLKVLLDEGMIDEEFIQNRTTGFEDVRKQMTSYSLQELASTAGVSVETIQEAARRFGKAETGMVFTARGVEQQASGTSDVRQYLHLLLATGKIGRRGCGYGAITGQGNGQGGREHGLKADQLPGYRSIENKADRQYVASVWGIEENELPRKGVSAYELFAKVKEGAIRTMLIMGSNPVVSSPNQSEVKRALTQLDFLVCVDMFISETAEYADLLLPTTSYLEDEGTMTNLEGRVVHRPAQRVPFGEAKHDWQILCAIAKALGQSHGFLFEKVEEIFAELCLASKGGIADYSGLSYERIKEKGILWPCPNTEHPGTGRLFEKSFYTNDGKARFGSAIIPQQKEKESRKYPYLLTTGRVMNHYLSGVQTRRSEALFERAKEPFAEIHPETGASLGIQEGELIKISTVYGKAIVKAKLSEAIRKDTVFVPFHWGGAQSINRTTCDMLDPVSRMPAFKRTACAIQKMIEADGKNGYSKQKRTSQVKEDAKTVPDPVAAHRSAENVRV